MDEKLAHILQQAPNPDYPYVYQGTKTHINKFGILNPDALDRVIRRMTALRLEMLQSSPIPGNYDLEHLRAFHQYLFQDTYEWAGQLRMVEFPTMYNPKVRILGLSVDPASEAFSGPSFRQVSEIEPSCNRILASLRKEDFANLPKQEMGAKLVHFMMQLFIVHPFRDGNGRTIRAFLRQFSRSFGWDFNLESFPQIERHLAGFNGQCGDLKPLQQQLDESLFRVPPT